jgi:hypothetical protein
MIGKLRRLLFVPRQSRWNAWVRDVTARLERWWVRFDYWIHGVEMHDPMNDAWEENAWWMGKD